MSKISWQTGKLRMNGDLGNHSKDQLFHSAHKWSISQTPKETKRESINSERKYYQDFLIGYALMTRGIWNGDILIADIEELGKFDSSEIYPRRLNAKEVLISQQTGECVFLVPDGTAKLSTNSKNSAEAGIHRKERESQRRISGWQGRFLTWRDKRWRRNSQRLLVHSRWFHLLSSCWTESSIMCAERRIIPNSTEVYWRNEVNSCTSGCRTRKTNWRLFKYRRKQKSVRCMDRFHEINVTKRNSTKRIHVVREENDKIQTTSRPDHIWLDAWTRIGKAAQWGEKQEWAIEKPNSIVLEIWREFMQLIQVTKITRISSRLQGERWRHQWQREHHVKEGHLEPAFGKPLFQKREISENLEQTQKSVDLMKWMNP